MTQTHKHTRTHRHTHTHTITQNNKKHCPLTRHMRFSWDFHFFSEIRSCEVSISQNFLPRGWIFSFTMKISDGKEIGDQSDKFIKFAESKKEMRNTWTQACEWVIWSFFDLRLLNEAFFLEVMILLRTLGEIKLCVKSLMRSIEALFVIGGS